MKLRESPFALRVVRRNEGDAAIIYRRTLTKEGKDRLRKMAAISPLAFSAGGALLRDAARACAGNGTKLLPGPFVPLDADWGARAALYALVSAGLRDAERLYRSGEALRRLDGTEAAWWLGLTDGGARSRAVRALRILTEAVE